MAKLRRMISLLLCTIAIVALFSACSTENGDVPIYETSKDLEGKKIGVLTGSTFDDDVKKTLENPEFVYDSGFNELIPTLLAKKAEAVVMDKPCVIYAMSENEEITYIDEELQHQQYGIIFAKTDAGAALRDDFNAYLDSLPDKEITLGKIFDTWSNADTSTHPYLDFESLPATNGTMRICCEAVDAPFEYYDYVENIHTHVKENRIVGYNIELLYRYCRDRGYAMVIDDMKFDALIPGVTSGKYDIGCSLFTITAERAEAVNFSEVTYESGPVFVIRTENSVLAQETSGNSFSDFLSSVALSFEKTFIRENRYRLFINGIILTILITVASLFFGTVVGFVTYLWYRKGGKVAEKITAFLSWLISGIPEVLLLLILFYIVFGKSTITGTWVSIIAFSMIVSVRVFEMTKTGVNTIDKGQLEAALAIGYSERRGFFRVIFPQALEFIMPIYRSNVTTLIKSTAIVGYLAVQDLTKISDIVRSRTYEAFFPLVVTAMFYFLLAWALIKAVNFIQKKLLPIKVSEKKVLKGIDFGEGDAE